MQGQSSPQDTHLYLHPDRDDLFAQSLWPRHFSFNEEVVRVFDDMVCRSIPLYREVLVCAAHWTMAYYQPHSRIIDVGCATGTFLEMLSRCLKQPATLVGIDNSAAMLATAQQKLAQAPPIHQVELQCIAAEQCSFVGSSVVVMNYTLHFLPLALRQKVLRAIYEGLLPGGLLFLSDKVQSPFPQFQEMITRHYEAFKTQNGYAQTEIERKKEALENVLIPLTATQQVEMLHNSGFHQVEPLIQLHHFVSWAAVKL